MECKNYPNCDTNFSSLIEQQAERIKELEAKLYRLYRAAIAEAEQQGPVAWGRDDGTHITNAEHNELLHHDNWAQGFDTAFYTTPQHAIPDGWQLVPVEPTTGMVEVAWDTIKRHGEAVILVYKRMLAAAPKPENSHDRR